MRNQTENIDIYSGFEFIFIKFLRRSQEEAYVRCFESWRDVGGLSSKAVRGYVTGYGNQNP